MDDKTLEMTMLLDFYGELLTPKQRECFEYYYNEDLSLAEIAEILDISRQGVRDLIVRAQTTLTEFEAKTGLIKRFSQQREIIEKMEDTIKRLDDMVQGDAKMLCADLQNELESMKLM